MKRIFSCSAILLLFVIFGLFLPAAVHATTSAGAITDADPVADKITISSILPSIIGAAGSICAAIIAGKYAKKLTKEVVGSLHSYRRNPEKLGHILLEAKHNVYFVMMNGNNMLEQYSDFLIYLAKSGIKLHFSILKQDLWEKGEQYVDGDTNTEIYKKGITLLQKINDETKGKGVDIKVFNEPLSASYIGIDLDPPNEETSIISCCVYQYQTKVKDSPITYIRYKNEPDLFTTTAKSIKKIMANSTSVSPEELLKDMQKRK